MSGHEEPTGRHSFRILVEKHWLGVAVSFAVGGTHQDHARAPVGLQVLLEVLNLVEVAEHQGHALVLLVPELLGQPCLAGVCVVQGHVLGGGVVGLPPYWIHLQTVNSSESSETYFVCTQTDLF